MNILYIDTSDNRKTVVKLLDNQRVIEELIEEKETRAQNVLELIQKLLKKTDTSLSDIEKVEINRGPGSYTGLKVGVSIANALSLALQIPVNEKALGEIETPEY